MAPFVWIGSCSQPPITSHQKNPEPFGMEGPTVSVFKENCREFSYGPKEKEFRMFYKNQRDKNSQLLCSRFILNMILKNPSPPFVLLSLHHWGYVSVYILNRVLQHPDFQWHLVLIKVEWVFLSFFLFAFFCLEAVHSFGSHMESGNCEFPLFSLLPVVKGRLRLSFRCSVFWGSSEAGQWKKRWGKDERGEREKNFLFLKKAPKSVLLSTVNYNSAFLISVPSTMLFIPFQSKQGAQRPNSLGEQAVLFFTVFTCQGLD